MLKEPLYQRLFLFMANTGKQPDILSGRRISAPEDAGKNR